MEAAIYIAATDKFGLDRRNIITYNFSRNVDSSVLDIWASFDGGKHLAGTKGKPDNIHFEDKFIPKESIPQVDSKMYLGTFKFYDDGIWGSLSFVGDELGSAFGNLTNGNIDNASSHIDNIITK
ncbi:MAG: hypothetical protein ACRC1M_04555 [Methanobacteriaceae archaeon]